MSALTFPVDLTVRCPFCDAAHRAPAPRVCTCGADLFDRRGIDALLPDGEPAQLQHFQLSDDTIRWHNWLRHEGYLT